MDKMTNWLRSGALVVGASALVAVAAPFGTSAFNIGPRFLYWLVGITVGWAQWSLILWIIRRLTKTNPWPSAIRGTTASFPFALAMALEVSFFKEAIGAPGRPGLITFLWILGIMLAFCWFSQILYWFMANQAAASEPPSEMRGDRDENIRFFRRIPFDISGKLLCLSTEDHYLRIHTTAGNRLLLFRLRDAVAELDGANGMQVHRSYWVSGDAIERYEKEGRKTALILSNGMRVPVSDSFLSSVREAGWLKQN